MGLVRMGLAAPPAAAHPAVHAAGFSLSRPEIRDFIRHVVRHDHLDRDKVRRLISQARPQPHIIELMNRPPERVLPWWQYRARLVTPKRIREGVRFWRQHRALLARTATTWGVPPQYLVAIIGIETSYGRTTGSYRVIDALSTLAFDYPPRGSYFRRELEQFLLLARDDGIDPLTATGSYAGAMGVPQFMPSSYRRYAVDGGHDRKSNLWDDWDDVLASIANYFRRNGWQPGAPVLSEVSIDPDATFQIDPDNLDLDTTVGRLSAQGVQVRLDVPDSTPALLIFAPRKDGPGYRVGFNNFVAITRYNHSALYAMAVHDLAQAIAHGVKAGDGDHGSTAHGAHAHRRQHQDVHAAIPGPGSAS